MSAPPTGSRAGIADDAADISVVVPTHNDGEFLERCLAALAEQTLPPLEVIVVDDGTGLPAALAGIAHALARFPDTRIIRQSAGGPSRARNRGLAACRGRFVAFVDCDDVLLPNGLAVKRALFTANPASIGAFAGIVFAEPDHSETRSRYPAFEGALDPGRIGYRNGVPGFLWAYLFRADALRDVGGLDERLRHMEDFDLLARLARTGGHFVGCNEPIYRQERHGSSLSRRSGLRQARGVLRFLRKARRERYFSRPELMRRYLRVPYAALKIMLARKRRGGG